MQMYCRSIIEILLIAIPIYYIYALLRGTQGAKIFYGLVIVFAFYAFLSQLFDFKVISTLVQTLTTVLIFSLLIIFQPELRHILATIGRAKVFIADNKKSIVIESVVQALEFLRERKQGALIAFQPHAQASQVTESGVMLDAIVSEEILCTIFMHKTPLHDGGVVICGDRIYSAGCIFPLTHQGNLNRQFGLRHRAALGMSEEGDNFVVVLSEETGDISICRKGKIERSLTPDMLRAALTELLLGRDHSQIKSSWLKRFFSTFHPKEWHTNHLTFSFVIEMLVAILLAFMGWLILMKKMGYSGVLWER